MHQSLTVDVEGSPMEVLLFEPEGPGPHPGLMIAQHLPVAHAGLEGDPFQLEVGRRYAAAGYVCAMPFIFHWWPREADMGLKREQFRDDRTVADLDTTFALLASRGDVDESRIGIVGHCWGGRVAWLGACHNPELAACALFYGGRVKLPLADAATPPIELAGRIRCPVLGVFGNEDANPTPADVDDYERALAAAGVVHEFHRYDGAGHGFQDFTNAERYREAPSEDAWAKAVDFLDRHLSSPD